MPFRRPVQQKQLLTTTALSSCGASTFVKVLPFELRCKPGKRVLPFPCRWKYIFDNTIDQIDAPLAERQLAVFSVVRRLEPDMGQSVGRFLPSTNNALSQNRQ
jgi:hypothetical protein